MSKREIKIQWRMIANETIVTIESMTLVEEEESERRSYLWMNEQRRARF